ncbi:MAG: polyphosphate kinase 2 family protein [Myxococcales bacterium]|nr:polyphosphate kinase 2 family protein [Myxococcales bacterium]
MFRAPDSPHLVPFDGTFEHNEFSTAPPADTPSKSTLKEHLREAVDELAELQRILYASNTASVLMMFQAMDAAGKDSTIRKVLSGVNPAGCQVSAFGRPSAEELDHDYLWRCVRRLPERGRIGVFNRSWYEEVLVVRVHPEYLGYQRLPWRASGEALWQERFDSIRNMEQHLARNGTVILKFFLNVSRDEQRKRFLARIDRPEKNWKFNEADLAERALWPAYMNAYQEVLRATSRPWAPWYAIPADDKPFMRREVARIAVAALQSLDLRYPTLDDEAADQLQAMRRRLEEE